MISGQATCVCGHGESKHLDGRYDCQEPCYPHRCWCRRFQLPATPADVDHAAEWVLADRIMSICYRYAVAMHESINSGRGAVGWGDLKQAAEIRAAIGDAFDGARDAARVAYIRGATSPNHRMAELLLRFHNNALDGDRFAHVPMIDGGPTPAEVESVLREAGVL